MRFVIIKVLEQNRLVPRQPIETVRNLDNDTFACPECGENVHITYWSDERGQWPDVSLPCKNCGRVWSILR